MLTPLARQLLAGLVTASAAPVLAQTESGAVDDIVKVLNDVVISAERVETLLRRTPVSAALVDGNEIAGRGVVQLKDLVGRVAGVTVPNGDSNMPQAVGIRGVGSSNPAMSQAVGVYLDDVPLIRGYATAMWDLPDIVRIEVLRGPQGTLYGQNNSAGAVKLVSIDPSGAPGGFVEVAAGNFGTRELRGYVDGSIAGGSLPVSLAFSRRINAGFAVNAVRQEDVNRTDTAQFRAKFAWTAGPATKLVVAIDGLRDHSDANTVNFPLNHPQAAPRVSYTSVDAGAFKRAAGGVALTLRHRLDSGVQMRWIGALRSYRDDPTVADFGGVEVQRYGISQTVAQCALSQELQLQSEAAAWRWTAGLMLVRDRFDFDRYTTTFPLAAPSPSYRESNTRLTTTDLGLYAQARRALSPTTGLTAGLRLYRTSQSGSNEFWRTDASRVRQTSVYTVPGLASNSSGGLPRIGIETQWSRSTFLYASLAQGAKFGGYNRAAESETAARFATQPERVTTVEAGAKGRWMNGRLSLALALFHNDYRDYLAALTNTTIDGALVVDAVLTNAGKARSWGADVEFMAQLGPHTRAALSLERLRSRFDTFANPTRAAASNYVGNELPYAPHISLGASIEHSIALRTGGLLTLHVELQHLGRQFADVANNEALALPRQSLLNTGVAWEASDRSWTLAVRVRNLQDRTYALLRTTVPPLGIVSTSYNAPRTLLFTARHAF